jgi:hypothetical protein
MRRFEILMGMHMGPLRRDIKPGDVIGWDAASKTLIINGIKIEDDKVNPQEAIAILERHEAIKPEYPWSRELSPVDVPAGQPPVNTGSQVVLPILGCLKAAEEFLATHRGWAKINRKAKWTPTNEDQYQFLKRFSEAKALVDTLGDNLKRKADVDVKVINAWLREHKFTIQLNPESDPRTFAVASILDVLVEWVKEGTITSVYNPKGTFPAVSLKEDGGMVVKYLNREIHPFPIARITTKSGDQVFMSIMDYMTSDTFAITTKVDELRKVTAKGKQHCDGVIFPMVDYDQVVDIDWIKGMETGSLSDDYYIGQAIQQTKFRMNEKGARAKSAVAMTIRSRCMAPMDNWVRIDKPFILWIERPGVSIPLFTGVFAENVWKKPAGSLEDL